MIKEVMIQLFKSFRFEEKGLTLMELIIAITMLAVISLAAFSGLHYAYYVIASSDEFVDAVYESQGDFETDLSQVNVLPATADKTSIVLNTAADSLEDESIEFNWESGTTLANFRTTGIRIERQVEGGSYLGDEIYIYVPVVNEDQ